jgi:flagellar basal-body rod protein FlgF
VQGRPSGLEHQNRRILRDRPAQAARLSRPASLAAGFWQPILRSNAVAKLVVRKRLAIFSRLRDGIVDWVWHALCSRSASPCRVASPEFKSEPREAIREGRKVSSTTAMPYGLYISAEGARAQSQRMEVIANNLANLDTPGFKRELAVFQARYAEAIEQGRDYPGSGSINDVGGGVMLSHTQTDFAPAPTKRTGDTNDFAILGEGFFVVQKGDQQYLTRAGNFQWTAEGNLVTQQGYAVLSDGGTPIAIDPTGGPFEVTPSGVIRQGGTAQRLALVKPNSHGDLVKVGENLFRPLAETQPLAEAERRVGWGYLEVSAVRPTTEMVQLIEAARAVEANINMMQTQDQMVAQLVARVMRS